MAPWVGFRPRARRIAHLRGSASCRWPRRAGVRAKLVHTPQLLRPCHARDRVHRRKLRGRVVALAPAHWSIDRNSANGKQIGSARLLRCLGTRCPPGPALEAHGTDFYAVWDRALGYRFRHVARGNMGAEATLADLRRRRRRAVGQEHSRLDRRPERPHAMERAWGNDGSAFGTWVGTRDLER